MNKKTEKSISSIFRIRIFLIVLVVFVLFSLFVWNGLTGLLSNKVNDDLDEENIAIKSIVESYYDIRNEIEKSGINEQDANHITQSTMHHIIKSHSFDNGKGIIGLAINNRIIATNNETVPVKTIDELEDYRIKQDFLDSLIYGSSLPSYSFNLTQGGYFLKQKDIVYNTEGREFTFTVFSASPRYNSLYYRIPFIVFLLIGFVFLHAALYVAIIRIIQTSIISNIKRTNETLEKIKAGDLGQRVVLDDISEFKYLSKGINSAVGSLQKSIIDVQAKIDQELVTARSIQESSLPNAVYPFPSIKDFDIYASMNPAREVGGDFFDIFLLDENRLCVLVADVSGKGIPAALFMMNAKAEIKANIQSGIDLVHAIQITNSNLCKNNDSDMFVTVFVGILHYKTGHFEYVNAGHNPPLIIKKDEVEWLKGRSGLFMAAYPSARFKLLSTTLDKEDTLFLYTDGVNEAMNEQDECFGSDQLYDFLKKHHDVPPRKLCDSLNRKIANWRGNAEVSDDTTMLALRYGVSPIRIDAIVVPSDLDHIGAVLYFFSNALTINNCSERLKRRVYICVEELYVNISKYAFTTLRSSIEVMYEVKESSNQLVVTFFDSGKPFDPVSYSQYDEHKDRDSLKIGGEGIHLVKRLSQDMTYQYDNGRNITSLFFDLDFK